MKPTRRILLIQTQAENAGAQEISRLVGAGLTARGYEIHNLFFFRKSDSFDEPPNTFYCSPSRPGNPISFLKFLWTLGRQIRKIKPDAVLTFQHFGNVIGGAISRLVSAAPVIANQVSSGLVDELAGARCRHRDGQPRLFQMHHAQLARHGARICRDIPRLIDRA